MPSSRAQREENVLGDMTRTVDHEQLKTILKLHYYLKRPLFVKGPPAIGKSDIIMQVGEEIAKEIGLKYVEYKDDPMALNDPSKFVLIDLRLAQLDPSDLRGIPWVYAIIRVPGKEKPVEVMIGKGEVEKEASELDKIMEHRDGPDKPEVKKKVKDELLKVPVSVLSQYPDAEVLELVTRWSPPSDLPIMGHGILFLDEMNLAAELNLKAAYQLILRRCLGEYRIPDGYAIFAAGNRQEDMASVTPFPSPLKSRFDWVELRTPSLEQWMEWASTHGVHPYIMGYLQYKPSALNQFDPNTEVDAQPTPRTWEFASQIMNKIGTSDIEAVKLMTSTAVGLETANELYAFIRMREKLPPIDDYIRDPTGTPLNSRDTAIVWTLLSGLAERYRYKEYDKKVLDACLKICLRLADESRAEMSVVFLQMLKSVDKDLKRKIDTSTIFHQISDRLVMFVGKEFHG